MSVKSKKVMVFQNSVLCCGCSACANVCPLNCIRMIPDEDGFYIPYVDYEKCINCSKCEKICPAINQNYKLLYQRSHNVYFAFNYSEEQRLRSSSGGIFILIAENIIESGGIVYGASFTDDFYQVVHVKAQKKEELNQLLGSKYVQSTLTYQFSEIRKELMTGRRVLFCGTPCQVCGLKNFLNKDFENLFCIDFICHGVPSQKAWKSYVDYLERKYGSKITSFSFRDKSNGWHDSSYSYSFSNSIKIVMPIDKDPYGKMFIRNNGLRNSCYKCVFKESSLADITLADAWGIEKSHPDMDDDKGASLMILNSQKGRQLVMLLSSKIKLNQCDIVETNAALSRLRTLTRRHPQRDLLYKYIDELSFDLLIKKYCKPSIRNCFGHAKRILQRIK